VRGGENSSKVVDNASEPSYSPSGKKITYLGDTPANPAIYTIGVSGGGKVKVTDTGVADSQPSWGSKQNTTLAIGVAINGIDRSLRAEARGVWR
jgi:Tol biopolymer transport system component